VTDKSATSTKQQKSAQKTQKPQVLPKVFTSTTKSNLAQPQQQASSASSQTPQSAIITRSERLPHNPNSVANIQRQLDPLAFDPRIKKLTN